MTERVKVTMSLAKITKGAYMFKELDAQGRVIEQYNQSKIGSLYVRKEVFDGERPDKITVTVETE